MGINHSLFNHSPIEGHVGCFQFLAIINEAAINTCLQVSAWDKFSLIRDKCARVQLLDHMVSTFLVLQGMLDFSRVAIPVYIFTSNACDPDPLYSQPTLVVVITVFFLRRGHSDWCVMVSHCDVNLHFPNSRGVEQPLLSVSALSWNVFSCLLSIFYLDCLDFYCWVLRFLYCICEFFFKYVVLDIFSHFVAWFFIPFTWSFEHWKF